MSRAPYVGIHVASGERRATAADIVASVQREIAGGALPAGSRLPPVRALEKQLGLSKNTAQAAYDELKMSTDSNDQMIVRVLDSFAAGVNAYFAALRNGDVQLPPQLAF
ncbi:MAG TPA: GntR family transcriptional regulator, partial [Kofleriaceae bacterium]|nr:GntR family transcriptional regulator [Kofleriaceae bacterium]